MTKAYKPEGCPSIMAYMAVPDCEKALDFYEKAFNFKRDFNEVIEDGGRIVHAAMDYDGSRFMIGDENKYPDNTKSPLTSNNKSPMALYIYCQDVDKLFEQAKKAGAKSIAEPEDAFWGDRMCRLQDPFGYEWSFGTQISK